MNDALWHYSVGSTQNGPVTYTQLQELASVGQLLHTSLVWQAGTPQWIAAGSVAGLFPASAPPPLPVAPVQMGYYAPPQYPSPNVMGQDAGMRMLLPVGRSGWAIAAGYLGLLSLLMIPGPLAVIFGFLAVADIRKNAELHGMGRAIFGIVMGVIGTAMLIMLIFTHYLR